MKINFHMDTTQQVNNNHVMKVLHRVAQSIAEEHHVHPLKGAQYLLMDADGQLIFFDYMKNVHNVNVSRWEWKQLGDPFAHGIDIEENADFSKFLLQHSSKE